MCVFKLHAQSLCVSASLFFALHAVSAERCLPPMDVPYGNISYTNEDPANILVGDVISYTCEAGMELHGPAQRFCLRTGNWSGSEPECIGMIGRNFVIVASWLLEDE